MKKIISIVSGLFLFLVLAVAGFIGYAAYQGRGLDATSEAYVEGNVPPIISAWSKDELLKRASPQLLKVINEKPEESALLFQKLSKLGTMQSLRDIKGGAYVSYTIQNGKVTTATYTAIAKFENGDGLVSVRLIQSPPSGEWQFLSFYIDSPLFMQ